MDDLISRQSAIDVADRADCTELAVEDVKKVTDEVVKEIKKLPSAQPEIIRCKDCKHWTTMVERPKHGTCDQWCTLNVTRRDEYCSKAERKEE